MAALAVERAEEADVKVAVHPAGPLVAVAARAVTVVVKAAGRSGARAAKVDRKAALADEAPETKTLMDEAVLPEQKVVPRDIMREIKEPRERKALPQDTTREIKVRLEPKALLRDTTPAIKVRLEPKVLLRDTTPVIKVRLEQRVQPPDTMPAIKAPLEPRALPPVIVQAVKALPPRKVPQRDTTREIKVAIAVARVNMARLADTTRPHTEPPHTEQRFLRTKVCITSRPSSLS